MTLRKKGKQDFGDTQADIRPVLLSYSKSAGYLSEHYADATCACGHKTFELQLDEDQGAAFRICRKCAHEHPIGDSADYLEDAELSECECPCGNEAFEITVGVALYEGSEDVKWLYIGCRCVDCGLIGCYGDWKNEFSDFRKFLALI